MHRVINLACAALFAGTTLCALVLSASSTLAKAEAVGVPGGAVWSAVGVLELVSLAGTLRWLVATTPRGRLHAVLVVGAVATVTGVAGWASFGWFGLVAPAAVVATIHMVVETLTELSGRTATPEVPPLEPEQWGPPSAVTEPVEAQPEPEPEPVRTLEPVGWTVEAIVTDLREQGRLDAHQRYIRDNYRCGPSKANKVLDALRLEVAS